MAVTIPISSFYPQILSELPKCPKVLVSEMIVMTCIDFCEQALIHREIQAPYTIVANTRGYAFVPITNCRVYKVMSAELAGVPIDYETPEALDIWYPGWRKPTNVLQTGGVPAMTQLDELNFILVPTPTVASQELILDVAYKPINVPLLLADILKNEYYDEIAAGTKARLMIMHDKPWSNPALAAIYAKVYDDAAKNASTRQQEGFGRPRVRTRGQFM